MVVSQGSELAECPGFELGCNIGTLDETVLALFEVQSAANWSCWYKMIRAVLLSGHS
jgi:hypothetical protein